MPIDVPKPQVRKILFRECPLEAGELDALRAAYPGIVFEAIDDPAAARAAVRDADAVIGGNWNDELLAQARALRWVQTTLAGVDHLPVAGFAQRGIALTTFRGASAPSLSEHVLAMMLAIARGIPQLVRRQVEKSWRPFSERPPIFELTGQIVGILGFGALGSAIGQRCHALGMQVWVGYRTARELPDFVARALPMTELGQLLGGIDHLVLALPSTPETQGLMNQATLAMLKPGACLYNVGRGDCIDQPALIAALQSGHLRAAGLDVTSPEPLPPSSPLWDMPQVLITGHTAGQSPKRWQRGMEIIVENIGRFCDGRPLINQVT